MLVEVLQSLGFLEVLRNMEFLQVLQEVVPLAIPANVFFVPVAAWLGLCIWAIGANLISR